MSLTVQQRWKNYCQQLSETARRFESDECSTADDVHRALQRLINDPVPDSESELHIRMGKAEQLIDQLKQTEDDHQRPYAESKHHESMPQPEASMAEQTELARDSGVGSQSSD